MNILKQIKRDTEQAIGCSLKSIAYNEEKSVVGMEIPFEQITEAFIIESIWGKKIQTYLSLGSDSITLYLYF
ncbi:MAG: hypothetical protein MUC49_21045 [Raineya sp.]|jgi:hypothetical protein|nr:hypothetical protein [Raineya sp.]